MVGLIAGGAAGFMVGAVVVGCLVAGGQADDELERIAREREQQRSTDLGT